MPKAPVQQTEPDLVRPRRGFCRKSCNGEALVEGIDSTDARLGRPNTPCEGASAEDPWDVFNLDNELLEPEPEYGDFWEELDDDCNDDR